MKNKQVVIWGVIAGMLVVIWFLTDNITFLI